MARRKYKRKKRIEPPHDATLYGPWSSDLKPAPGDLRLVQSFVNTRPRRGSAEKLTSPKALADWLRARRLLAPEAPLGGELEQAVAVREGIFALIRADQGATVDSEAVRRLDRIVSAAPLVVRFDASGASSLEPAADGLGGALARLAAIVAVARIESRWPLLRACADPACRRVFYDFDTHNTRWCMKRCATRAHNRAYRQKRRRLGYS